MLWYCILVFIGSLIFGGLLKSLGIQGLIMGGSAYAGALIILDWINSLNGGGLEAMVICSVTFSILYIVIWILQIKISPVILYMGLAVCEILFYWCVDNEPFIQAIIIAVALSVITIGCQCVMELWAEEFCERWDLEMPRHNNGKHGRCPRCGSSRVTYNNMGEGGYGYYTPNGYYVAEDYTCRRCNCRWHHNFGQTEIY